MSHVVTEVRISEEVAASTEEYDDSCVPATGNFDIVVFHGEGAFDPNAAVKLVWDFGGGSEEVIWTIKGSGSMPFRITLTGNNSKKLAVTLDNGMSGSIFMSGYFKIIQET